jgi:molybdate transport system substrate-binding protein
MNIKLLLLASCFLGACGLLPPAPRQQTLTVSIAASLQTAMQEIQVQYQGLNPEIKIDYNIASSGALQQQIEQGAPVDIFISADAEQARTLVADDQVVSQQDLLQNQVVLVVPKTATGIQSFTDLQKQQVTKIALGYPDSVPAGQYSQQVLVNLKLYETLKPKIIFTKDVRQALFYVETNNVDAGFVYATDAQQSQKVKVVEVASPKLHSPIRYSVTILKRDQHPQAAQAFVQFLNGRNAQTIFKAHGFQVPRP